jgi:hypothetical protein
MAILSGGSSSWKKLTKDPIGTVTTGSYVSFTPEVASKVASYGPQDILVLNIDGQDTSIPCPAQLGKVFRNNKIEVGTVLAITFNGKKNITGGKTANDFRVESIEGDTSFPPKNDAPKNDADEEAALAAKIAALKAKKKAA